MNLIDLEIVGYADVLNPLVVPHAVPPIYRFRNDHERLLFPPFQLAAELVIGGTIDSPSAMRSLVASGQATAIEPAIPAAPDHELWIDQDLKPHYEPFAAAEKNLKGIAIAALGRARQFLKDRELDQAEQAAGTALAADDRLVESLAIKAAVAKLREEHDDVETFRRFAMKDCTAETFDGMVEELLRQCPSIAAHRRRFSGIAGRAPMAMPLPKVAA